MEWIVLCNQLISMSVLQVYILFENRVHWKGNLWFDGGYDVRCHFQQYFRYIMEISFIRGGNRSTLKTTDLSQVTDKLYYIMLYRVHLTISWIHVIKFVSDLRQVIFFYLSTPISSTNKTEILLKVALNTITITYNRLLLHDSLISLILL